MLNFRKFFLRQKGQGVVEYAMLLGFMIILLIGLMINDTGNVKTEVSKTFAKTASIFKN